MIAKHTHHQRSSVSHSLRRPSNPETPTPVNPLGARGIGESATIGATPAVHNAIRDALAPFGVRYVEMPANGERVWRALQNAANRDERQH